MWGNMSISQLNTQSTVNRSYPGRQNLESEDAKREANDKINQMKRLIRGEEKQKPAYLRNDIRDSMTSYSESIRKSRESSKNTASQVKQLKYNFKDISGQIRRSKTSTSAKQVAAKAKREVVLLKMKKQSGQYDDEELSAAIAHAQAMERAAKKKLRHLLEEELVKIKDDAADADNVMNTEETIEAERDKAFELVEEEMQEQIAEETQEQVEEATADLIDEMTEMMKDMIDDAFSELAEGMFAVTNQEMTEEDFKELVKRHRTSEDKDMVKADMEYLKAMFDRYNSMGYNNIPAFNSGLTIDSMPSPEPAGLTSFTIDAFV